MLLTSSTSQAPTRLASSTVSCSEESWVSRSNAFAAIWSCGPVQRIEKMDTGVMIVPSANKENLI